MTTARHDMDADFANPQRLERMLAFVDNHRKQTRHPAQRLDVEVDGEVVAGVELSSSPEHLNLPSWCRSLTLRDEEGVARAHILLQDQLIDTASFDQGRLLISVKRVADGSARLTIEQASVHVP